jgi:spore coat polysaccharide biosynthesis predicted glycosyltransferase SpsG
LITFGGTDQHNLTLKTLKSILPFCTEKGIFTHIVAGPGYMFQNELVDFIDECCSQTVSCTFATGIISRIMEMSDIAISSNGRTVYELAHMNLPSLIISQHTREATHQFACPENGFIPVGCSEDGDVNGRVLSELKRIVSDEDLRKDLHNRMVRFDFLANKSTVVALVHELLEKPLK